MALVTISQQPGFKRIVSSLLPIYFRFVETSADTVNVVAQVHMWISGGWTNWGGQIRCADILNQAGNFSLDISDLVAGLPQGDLYDLRGLGWGDGCMGGSMTTIQEKNWEDVSTWAVRVSVQREYKDATTGLIVLDPDTEESAYFFVHQGAANMELGRFGYRAPGEFSLQVFNHQQLTSGQWESSDRWLWMTDAPYQMRPKNDGATNPRIENEYRVKCSADEQHYISFINGDLKSGITNEPYMVIETYGVSVFGGGYQLLQTHTHNYFEPPHNRGYLSIDVGWRTLRKALSFSAAEGVDGAQVEEYYIYNMVADTSDNYNCKSINWHFIIDKDCNGVGTRRAYQRFAWKNKVGAYDFCTANGIIKSKIKTKPRGYQKRSAYQSFNDYGDAYYQNTSQEVMDIESEEMDYLTCKYLACVGESTEVYLRMEIAPDKFDVNAQSFANFDMWESWRDYSMCNTWVPILIVSKSIRIYNTKDNSAKIKFSYTFANKQLTPRR
jgi:hypothetical protein